MANKLLSTKVKERKEKAEDDADKARRRGNSKAMEYSFGRFDAFDEVLSEIVKLEEKSKSAETLYQEKMNGGKWKWLLIGTILGGSLISFISYYLYASFLA